jgi:hypothetical protein
MKRFVLAACVAAAMVAGGCGDDDDNGGVTTPPTTGGETGGGGGTPSGCTQTTLSDAGETSLGRHAWSSTAFTTATDGRLDITVSRQSADANVGAFVVRGGSCTQAQFQGNQCSFILASSGDDNPEQISGRVPAGNYELLLQNFGGGNGQSEPVTAKVVLSAGTDCPAFPTQ